MAKYTGPVTVDVSSYSAFRNATLGNWYDVDGVYGAQCVDYFKLLNYNIGYSSPYAKTGEYGYSSEMWTNATSRVWNQTGGTSTEYYDLITSLEDVKQGDMMIMSLGITGHNAIATTDYSEHTTSDGKTYMILLGQNQENASSTEGHAVTETNVNVSGFLGAFRLKAWQGSSPTPTPTPVTVIRNETSFPWVLYSNKLRARRLK